jgi:hypothetical protein
LAQQPDLSAVRLVRRHQLRPCLQGMRGLDRCFLSGHRSDSPVCHYEKLSNFPLKSTLSLRHHCHYAKTARRLDVHAATAAPGQPLIYIFLTSVWMAPGAKDSWCYACLNNGITLAPSICACTKSAQACMMVCRCSAYSARLYTPLIPTILCASAFSMASDG